MDVTSTRAQIQKALLKYTKKDEPALVWTEVAEAEKEPEPEPEPEEEASAEEGAEEEAPADERRLSDWSGEPYSPKELRRLAEGVRPLTRTDYNAELLELYRELLMKIVVLKNDHLDQLCGLEDAVNGIEIKTDPLQQSVRTFSGDVSIRNPTVFSYTRAESDTDIKATLPTPTMLQAMRAKNGGNMAWMCVQVSFMQPNPAAGFEPNDSKQFFFEN